MDLSPDFTTGSEKVYLNVKGIPVYTICPADNLAATEETGIDWPVWST